jgi:ferritin-like metal-binding protein YciE
VEDYQPSSGRQRGATRRKRAERQFRHSHPNPEVDSMSQSTQKVLQYLNEAHASELGLVRVLQSQIAITPRGSYRTGLEKHLQETRDHAQRLETRIGELGQGINPFQATIGIAESVISQSVALGMLPFQLLRGTGGEEKVLKNAKDASATEALEIATYTAIEQLANSVGDETTAKLAASIRADEEKMLERIIQEIPKLTEAVVRAEVKGNGSYDIATTGAADATRAAGRTAKRTAKQGTAKAKRTTRQARKAPGAARAEGTVKGAVATEQELPIPRYNELTADEIVAKLPELSQVDLAKVETYERRNDNRTTITSRIGTLRTSEPWAGYDELTVEEIRTALADADEDRARAAREYERAHKDRAGVLEVTERELANA